MSFPHRLRCLLICALVCCTTPEAQPAPIPRVTKEQVQQWITQLESRSFSVRQQAEDKLWKAGRIAEAPLRAALKSPSLEVRTRAGRVLAKFRWGIYPDTPKALLELIQQYRAGTTTVKLKVISSMFDQGERGAETVLKIVEQEEEGLRRQLYQKITQHVGRSLPQLLIDNKLTTVETLLELAIRGEPRSSIPNYVTYHTLRKDLPKRIAEYEQLVTGKGADAPELEVLLYLYRAKGEAEKARKIAVKTGRDELIIPLLQEQGEWQLLSQRDAGLQGARRGDFLAWRMAHHRLAGNQKAYQKARDELMEYASELDEKGVDRWYVAKSLFINGEKEEALKLLKDGFGAERKFEILCALQNYDEAFALLDGLKKDGKEFPALEARRAQFLYVLGKTDEAKKLFDSLVEKMGANPHQSWHLILLEAEQVVGLNAEVKAQVLKQLSNNANVASRSKYLKFLIPGKESEAAIWWEVLDSVKPGQKPEQIVEQLQDLFAGKVKGEDLTKLIQKAQTALNVPQRQPDVKANWHRAIAEVALAAGDFPAVVEALRAAATEGNSSSDLVRLGDEYAKQKKWAEAVKVYQEAWEKNRLDALALFLRGWALTKLGQKEEGEKWKETSHWILLALESSRTGFARDLEKRGWEEDAQRELQLVRQCGRLGDFSVGEAYRQKGIQAFHNGDFLTAAHGHELAMLRVLTSYVSFVQERAYVTIPAYVHELRARGYVLAGNLPEAKKEIAVHQAILPKSINLAVGVVPLLDKKGYSKEADQLFQQVLAEQDARCKKYTNSAATLNSYCWLCAVCRRNLDEAETRAKKAVSLAPGKSGYQDTLAEILFQQGKKDEAIQLMKACLKQDPERDYYKLQLKRFEAGDKSAPLPPE